MSGLDIVTMGGRYAVVRRSRRGCDVVSGNHGNWYMAEAALSRIEARERERERPCLRCGASMVSTGAHHRLCDGCRARHSGLDAQLLAASGLAGG